VTCQQFTGVRNVVMDYSGWYCDCLAIYCNFATP